MTRSSRARLGSLWQKSACLVSFSVLPGYSMVLTIDTAQVATGPMSNIFGLLQTCCGRKLLRQSWRPVLVTHGIADVDTFVLARMSSSSDPSPGKERPLQAQPEITGKEQGKCRSCFQHKMLEIWSFSWKLNIRSFIPCRWIAAGKHAGKHKLWK